MERSPSSEEDKEYISNHNPDLPLGREDNTSQNRKLAYKKLGSISELLCKVKERICNRNEDIPEKVSAKIIEYRKKLNELHKKIGI